jgi:hypothetical protein
LVGRGYEKPRARETMRSALQVEVVKRLVGGWLRETGIAARGQETGARAGSGWWEEEDDAE